MRLREDPVSFYCQQSLILVYIENMSIAFQPDRVAAGTLLPRNYGTTRKKQRNNHGTCTELHRQKSGSTHPPALTRPSSQERLNLCLTASTAADDRHRREGHSRPMYPNILRRQIDILEGECSCPQYDAVSMDN